MPVERSISLICDNCHKEFGPFSWESKSPTPSYTVHEVLQRANKAGWRRITVNINPKGGAKHFYFCESVSCIIAGNAEIDKHRETIALRKMK